ncbi:MAG: trypsin-like peptidase domain-containing protein, partial [Planctomycetota bacterium]
AVFGPDAGGGGSGVIITPDGYALTNYHVTNPCGDYMRCGMSNGALYDAVIVGLDPGGDVALIKLFGRDDFPTAVMGDSDQLRAGDSCFVAGNPFVLATNFEPTVTYGMISGVHRYQPPAGTLLEYADCIQTDAAINPGNSGGPLFNADGELVGINGRCSFEKRGRVNVGVGYAISINQIKKFLGSLHSGRIVDHATLGFTVSDQDGRVLVSNMLRSSDAYRRGIRYEDEILSIDGVTIDSANALKNRLGTYPKNWRIPITFRRDLVDQTVLVRLAGVHAAEALFELLEAKPKPSSPPHDHPEQTQAEETPEMPEIVREHFEKRWGFANYHYNRVHLDRILMAVRSAFPSGVEASEWKLKGDMKREGPFQVAISQETVLSVLPSGSWNIADQPEFSSADLVPSGSGGLLLSLQMWHRLVRSTSDDPALSYGELIYEGQAPLNGVLHDTVLGVHKNLETRYFFDPVHGRLAALEMFPDAGVDPCELNFVYENDQSSQAIGFTVTHGDQRVGEFEIEEFRVD